MTYNLRHGGRPDRLPAIAEVIQGQAPDVLAVQELGQPRRRPAALPRLAQLCGLRPYLAGSWWGQPVGMLVRPGLPVTAAGPVRRPFHHAAIRVTVATDQGPLAVIGTHLYPYSGWRRRCEAGWLARLVRHHPAAIVLGDLNTLDPWTDHRDRLRRLPVRYRRRHRRRGRGVDTRAVEVLVRAGLVDLARHRPDPDGRVTTAPTALAGVEFADMRLDYILGTPPVAAATLACAPRYGGQAEVASDHYPVVATLDLNGASG